MKNTFLIASFSLLAVGAAHAQQSLAFADSIVIRTGTVKRYSRPPHPLLTSADSAGERARRANAHQLRMQPIRPVHKLRTTPAMPSRYAGTGEYVDPAELETRARLRRAQSQHMIDEVLDPKGKRRQLASTAEPARTPASAAKPRKQK